MKYLIIFATICIIIYSAILSADPLENAVIYKTSAQQLIELTEKYDWIDSELYEIIRFNCQKYGVDIQVVCAIIQTESGGNERAFNYNSNGTKDRGLMQINSIHGHGTEIYKPEINIEFGCKYLKKCVDKSDTMYQAVSMYNTGFNADWINYEYVNKINRWL